MKKINLTILAVSLMFFFTLAAVGCAQTSTDTMGAGNMKSSMESMSGDTMDKDIDKGMDTMSSEKMDESMDKDMGNMDAEKMDGSTKKDMQDNMK